MATTTIWRKVERSDAREWFLSHDAEVVVVPRPYPFALTRICHKISLSVLALDRREAFVSSEAFGNKSR